MVFAEVIREFISSLGFGFYEDQSRNYLIDFMITCQFELPRSQLLFIMRHVICLTIAFKDPSKYKDFSIVQLMNAKKEFLKIQYVDFRKAFEMCINPESKGGFGIIGKFALD